MLVTEFGMVTDVKPLQPRKAPSPILVTEFGMVADVKPLQPLKVAFLILVTEFGIVTDVKLLQSEKALSPILVTVYSCPSTVIELGITTFPEYSSSPEVTSAVFAFEIKL